MAFAEDDLKEESVSPLMEDVTSGFGQLRAARHSAKLSQTPAFWARPAAPLGNDKAEWPAASA